MPGQPRGSGAFACEIRIGIGNGIPGAGESELALRGGVARGRSGGRRALVDPEAPQDGAHGGGVGGPNELWQMDVTYIHIAGSGWHYAVTVIDYYSRYLLACHLTTSYCAAEVIAALRGAREEAERIHGPLTREPTLVTDNGPSFLARRFAAYVGALFSHVRIAYRTPTQLGLLERFHETLKREEVYWNTYNGSAHCRKCLGVFRERYNRRRPHWALVPENGGDPVTPFEVYACGVATTIPKWQGWARAARQRLEELRMSA